MKTTITKIERMDDALVEAWKEYIQALRAKEFQIVFEKDKNTKVIFDIEDYNHMVELADLGLRTLNKKDYRFEKEEDSSLNSEFDCDVCLCNSCQLECASLCWPNAQTCNGGMHLTECSKYKKK